MPTYLTEFVNGSQFICISASLRKFEVHINPMQCCLINLYFFSVCFTNKFGKLGIFEAKRSHFITGWIPQRRVSWNLPCSYSSGLQSFYVSSDPFLCWFHLRIGITFRSSVNCTIFILGETNNCLRASLMMTYSMNY